jgi:hypothetical protein
VLENLEKGMPNRLTVTLAKWLDHARGRVEVVGIVRQAHPGPELGGKSGKFLIRCVDAGVSHVRRLVDDEMGGGKPVDERRVISRV